jgi:ABC-2 type transport system ATP-binding protein
MQQSSRELRTEPVRIGFYSGRMTTSPIIEAEGLTKRFTVKKATVEAVTDLTFQVAEGELVAFLGPNGAGKSTSLRMLTTLIPPTEGSARVVGHDILRDPSGVRARIGYVGQLTSGSFSQRVRDELLSQGAFYGMGRADAVRRADELIESLDLASFATRAVQQLSGGQKRRLDVALGLMHAPPLLFLDEPSTGLDPQSRANLWQHILKLREDHGTTVFLTTHYLEEADRFAERVMVMDRGRVIADDTAANLKATLAGDVIRLGFADAADAERAVAVVQALTDREVTRVDDNTVGMTVPEGESLLPAAIRRLDAEGLVVQTATGVPPTLDDVFLALTGRTLREAGEGERDSEADADSDSDAAASESTTDSETSKAGAAR